MRCSYSNVCEDICYTCLLRILHLSLLATVSSITSCRMCATFTTCESTQAFNQKRCSPYQRINVRARAIRWAHLWIPLGVLAIAVEDEIWQDVNESSDSAVSRRQPGDGGGGGIDDDDDVAAWDAYRHDHVQLQRRIHALELLVRLDRDAMYVNHRILNRTVISGGIDAESMLIGDCLWLSWTSSKRLFLIFVAPQAR
eukprot:m.170977 g.170977  ORF g.170977 m.170977 type:complete len:198 (+) comp18277_c0_seq1:225-818(+)